MTKLVLRCLCLLLTLFMCVGIFSAETLAVSDTESPVLHSLTLSATTVAAPGEVEMVADVSDDYAGVWYVNVTFYCKETDQKIKVEAYEDPLDGKFRATIQLDPYTYAGTYRLECIEVTDYSWNTSWYGGDPDEIGGLGSKYPIPNDLKSMSLVVTNVNPPDYNPPVLQNVTLSTTTVSAPGQVEVIVYATDDLSGVASRGKEYWEHCFISFYCAELGYGIDSYGIGTELSAEYWDESQQKMVPYPDGALHGTIEVHDMVPKGTYQLSYVALFDNAGNCVTYTTIPNEYPNETPLPELLKARQFYVSNSDRDYTPPVLKNVILSNTTVTLPGQVEITVEADDDYTGLQSAWVWFHNKESKSLVCLEMVTRYDGITLEGNRIHGTLYLTDVPEGTYELCNVTVWDNHNNSFAYDRNPHPEADPTKIGPLPDELMGVQLTVRKGNANGWVNSNGEWYYYRNGQLVKGEWLKDRGNWYYLYQGDGIMATGWTEVEGQWYYMDANGVMQTGWVNINGEWFYLDKSGVMVTGVVKIEGKYHKFTSSGVWRGEVKEDGWVSEGKQWYYFKNGSKTTGWCKIANSYYFFDDSGVMQTGWLKRGNTWYYLQSSGAMSTGWVQVGDNWYFMNESGAMQTGWLKRGNTWYYLDSSGIMSTGWVQDGGKWYFMNESGVMQTGWLKRGNTWYYLSSSGAMHTGWLKLGNSWYYMKDSGAMVTGTHVINGVTYKFNSSGVWLP